MARCAVCVHCLPLEFLPTVTYNNQEGNRPGPLLRQAFKIKCVIYCDHSRSPVLTQMESAPLSLAKRPYNRTGSYLCHWRRNDGSSCSAYCHQYIAFLIEHDHGHRWGLRSLARLDKIDRRWRETKLVCHVWRAEVVHFVVVHKTEFVWEKLGSETAKSEMNACRVDIRNKKHFSSSLKYGFISSNSSLNQFWFIKLMAV